MSVPHYDFSFRQTAGEAVTARPSFISFTSPYYIQFDSWDDTQNFYDDEMTAEEQLYAAMDANTTPDPELSSRITWRLQQSFVKNYLQWYPLIEPDALVQHVQIAQAGHFLETNPSNCLTMFAFAIGCISEDKGTSFHELSPAEFLSGLNYFRHGSRILHRLAPRTRRDITVLQCRLLYA